MPIRVAITDDHPLVITGLEKTLSLFDHIEICGVYESGIDLLNGLEKVQPDVLLLDIHMPGKNGLELALIIKKKYPEVRILVLTGAEEMNDVKKMIQAGCLGYLYKRTTDQKSLIHAIEQVYAGELYMESSLQKNYMRSLLKLKDQAEKGPKLTQRELEILRLIMEEYSSAQIAEKLFISERTVENHRFSIMQKLDAKNTVGLVKMAIQLGLG